jgi:hypothetical protein
MLKCILKNFQSKVQKKKNNGYDCFWYMLIWLHPAAFMPFYPLILINLDFF